MSRRVIASLIILCFSSTLICVPQVKGSEMSLKLPTPGSMVNLSPAYEPTLIKGLTIHRDNPLLFDFIMDTGNDTTAVGNSADIKVEADRLIKYFFACLTIPEKDLWVNLSPYEKNRMIPEALGQTALGRDLLTQDYILKQLTASLIYPEKNLGKEFWNRVYAKSRELYGTAQVPVNTFNKVWILADKASVYENGQTAFVLDGHLKVMLDEDYLSLTKHLVSRNVANFTTTKRVLLKPFDTHSIASNIIRQIILPEIEKEVNTGKNFASLRQIFNSLILATWYKRSLKDALLNQVYSNKSTVKGVNLKDPSVKEQIYQQYLKAYKKGVFNYIKEDVLASGQTVPRKYFSGGFNEKLDEEETFVGPGSIGAWKAMSHTAENFKHPLRVTAALTVGFTTPASAAMSSNWAATDNHDMIDKTTKLVVELLGMEDDEYHMLFLYLLGVLNPFLVDSHITIEGGKSNIIDWKDKLVGQKVADATWLAARYDLDKEAIIFLLKFPFRIKHVPTTTFKHSNGENLTQIEIDNLASDAFLLWQRREFMVFHAKEQLPRGVIVDGFKAAAVERIRFLHESLVREGVVSNGQLPMETAEFSEAFGQFVNSTDEKVVIIRELNKVIQQGFDTNLLSTEGSFLDIGSDGGKVTQGVSSNFKSAIAIELNPDEARHTKDLKIPNLEVINTSVQDFNPQQRFDFILLSHILYYLSNDEREKQIKRIREWLKPGGKIAIVLNDVAGGVGTFQDLNKLFGTQDIVVDPNQIASHYAKEGLKTNLTSFIAKVAHADKETMTRIIMILLQLPWKDLNEYRPKIQEYMQTHLWDEANHVYRMTIPQSILTIEENKTPAMMAVGNWQKINHSHKLIRLYFGRLITIDGRTPKALGKTPRIADFLAKTDSGLKNHAWAHGLSYDELESKLEDFVAGNPSMPLARMIQERVVTNVKAGENEKALLYKLVEILSNQHEFEKLLSILPEGFNLNFLRAVYEHCNDKNIGPDDFLQKVNLESEQSVRFKDSNPGKIKIMFERPNDSIILEINKLTQWKGAELGPESQMGAVSITVSSESRDHGITYFVNQENWKSLRDEGIPLSVMIDAQGNFVVKSLKEVNFYTDTPYKVNPAMAPVADRAVVTNVTDRVIQGGIDLTNASSGISVSRDANGGVKVDFDPAMIARIRRNGIQSAVPVIIDIEPMNSIQMRPLLGFDTSHETAGQLASA